MDGSAEDVPLSTESDEHPLSIDDLFQPLYGLPCWSVKQGHGSFLTLEFGQPHQTIHPVLHLKRYGRFGSRLVTLHGDWHLWIYCCSWRIKQAGEEIAHDESPDSTIARACAWLDGQALQRVKLLPQKGYSHFDFDLGGELITCPADDEIVDQWLLYRPNGTVATYRSDGKITVKSAKEP